MKNKNKPRYKVLGEPSFDCVSYNFISTLFDSNKETLDDLTNFLTEVFTFTEKPGLLQKKLFFYDSFILITSKVYTRRTYDKAVTLQSCFLDVLTRNTNLMTDKGFKFFDECAARCVHLSPEEEECISFPWGDSKMYKPGSISNSQRMLIEINESGVIAKIRISVEIDIAKLWRYLE